MDYDSDEPQQEYTPFPRPCSIPHSAPVGWLSARPEALDGAAPEPQPADEAPAAEPLPLGEVAAHLRANPEALAEFVADLAPEGTRGDGWTPFARKLFLQVLASTGRVSRALAYAGLTKQSAHALRQRDPLFAAGWDAAALMARNPLADEILEHGLDGITETVTRGGEVVAERHRYDSRLSIAALHRLDKRCDRAEEQGSAHLAIMRRWDEWLDLVGKGDEQAARTILDSPPHGQFGQLPERASPTPSLPDYNYWDDVWKNDEGVWLTSFPPPAGYAGYERGTYDCMQYYERHCTPEEVAALVAHFDAQEAEDRADHERDRDIFFAALGRRSAS